MVAAHTVHSAHAGDFCISGNGFAIHGFPGNTMGFIILADHVSLLFAHTHLLQD
jgi:hypothetical protein